MEPLWRWKRDHRYILTNHLYLMDYIERRYMESDMVQFNNSDLKAIAASWGYNTFALRCALRELGRALLNTLPFRHKD